MFPFYVVAVAVDDNVQNGDLSIPFVYYAAANAVIVIFGATLVTYVEVSVEQ